METRVLTIRTGKPCRRYSNNSVSEWNRNARLWICSWSSTWNVPSRTNAKRLNLRGDVCRVDDLDSAETGESRLIERENGGKAMYLHRGYQTRIM